MTITLPGVIRELTIAADFSAPPFRPILDRVLIRRDKSEQVTPGGIIIPQTGQRKATRGEVVAVGPGISVPRMACSECLASNNHDDAADCPSQEPGVIPLDVYPGDFVYFDPYGASETNVPTREHPEGEPLLIKAYYELLAVEPRESANG